VISALGLALKAYGGEQVIVEADEIHYAEID